MENLRNRIVVDPTVMVGKPVIKGTRIPIDLILKLVAQGQGTKEILEDYPKLTENDVKAALEYGAELVSGEEIFPLLKQK